MTIIEQNVTGKTSQEKCEDGIEANERFIAAIDGSTSKAVTKMSKGMSNGRYCMELVKDFITSMPADIDAYGFCEGITRRVRAVYDELEIDMNLLKSNPAERMAASAVVYSTYRKQIWMIGDCQCIADGTYHDNAKPQEKTLADKRASFLTQNIGNGLTAEEVQTHDPGRDFILNELIEGCKGQNITYSVIDGFDIPLDKIKIIDVEHPEQGVILASDGYPFLGDSLQESEEALKKQLEDKTTQITTLNKFISFSSSSYSKGIEENKFKLDVVADDIYGYLTLKITFNSDVVMNQQSLLSYTATYNRFITE